MAEYPPGGDYAAVGGDPSKTETTPRASCTPNPAGEQDQGERVCRGNISQPTSHFPESKKRKVSLGTSASQILKKHEDAFFNVVNPRLNLFQLKRKGVIPASLISKIDAADDEGAKELLFDHLHRNADVDALKEYCKMAIAANAFPRMQKVGERMLNELELEEAGWGSQQTVSEAGALGVPTQGSQAAVKMSVSQVTAPGMAMAVTPVLSLESCKMDIVSCDIDVFKCHKHPAEAIMSLYFNTYNHLIRILRTHCSTIKSVAVSAVHMKQVTATADDVKQAQNLHALFACLEVDKKWDDLHFLDVVIMSLPAEASKEKEAAQLVMAQYKSYLTDYMKAVSIKEGKDALDFLQRKRGREEKMVVTEITVDREIHEYTCYDLLDLWKLFLIENMEIPEDRIEYRHARVGNSTILIFKITHTYCEGIREKLSKPAVVWVMKELGILRMCVSGVVSMDIREALPKLLNASIQEGLKSGVNFASLTKVIPPLMCSLVDPVLKLKETQLDRIQPHRAVPAQPTVPELVVEAATSSASAKECLLLAAEQGRLHEVQALLDEKRCEVNDEDEEGFTAILKAALNGHLTVVRTLVEQYRGNVLHRKKGGRNAFHLCADSGHLAVAEYLVSKMEGHHFDSDDDGNTALHRAAFFRQLSMVKYLVGSCEFNVKAIDKKGYNAFLLCAMVGDLATAEYLSPKMEAHLFDSDDAGYTALHWAAQEGQLSMVEYLVRSCGFDVKAIDKWGKSPVLRAAQEGHVDITRFLLKNGNSVCEQSHDGWTAVLLAAHCGHQKLVQDLCEIFGANILYRKEGGHNAFLLCVMGGHLAVAKYLASKMEGHLFDSDDTGYTALHWAAREGQLPMVKYLMTSCGLDEKAIDKWGNTPLLIATEEGHAEVLCFLLENGSSVREQNNDGMTTLLVAAYFGHKVVVQKLCETFRADILHRMKGGRNAFHLCAEGGHLAVAEYLAPRMEGHLFDSDDDGYTALHLAAYFGQLSMVEYLVRSCRLDVKAIDKWGRTPLLRAAWQGNAAVACFLLQNGSSIQEQDHDGCTAVLLATCYGHTDLVHELYESFGADVLHRMKGGFNAFHLSTEGGHVGVAKYLAPKMGGHVFDLTDAEDTALHRAAMTGHLPMVKHLVTTAGFQVKVKNKVGQTPFLTAAARGHVEVASFLLDNGSSIRERTHYKDTALHLAAHGGHLNMVKFLVPLFGVRVHAKNIYHQTCRGIAEREGCQHVVEYLDLAAQKAKGCRVQ